MDHLFFSCDIMKMWWSEISIIVLKEVSSGYNNVARLWISTSKNDAINMINAAFTWTIWNVFWPLYVVWSAGYLATDDEAPQGLDSTGRTQVSWNDACD
jgi:hypothetical protein